MARINQQLEDRSGDIAQALARALSREGIRHAFAPSGVSRDLWEEVSDIHVSGLLADDLYGEYQEYWRFVPPEGMGEPRTFIAVAWPSPLARIRFEMDEGSLDALVPPTYISSAGRTRCLDTARSVLQPAGYGVEWARAPVKLLAERTGLACYGRNNIAYVNGLGSYVRLGVLCTDADLRSEPLGADHAFMEECAKCRACVRACPTGCIPKDGTVIDAAHCLTQANENEGAWPSWVAAEAHNSLVGCMRCQEICPVNRAQAGREPELVAEFDRQETAVILQGLQTDRLPDVLRAKLAALDLDEYSSVLGRNLRALQQSSSR